MARVNIYIRQENEKAWEEFGGSEFVNRALKSLPEMRDTIKMAYDPANKEVAGKPIKKVLKVVPDTLLREKVFNFCKHDQVKGMCRKGCK